jgi:hypothetical protein
MRHPRVHPAALGGNYMPFSLNDIHSVGEILAFAARTEIMPRFRQLTPAQVRRKSSTFDLVTEADEAAEVAITAALNWHFPTASSLERRARTDNPRCSKPSLMPN